MMYPPPQRRSRSTPSFSSTLLDSIYHSIDSNQNQNQNQTTSSTIIKKDTNTSSRVKMNLRQAVMIEDWMEKQTSTTTTTSTSSSSSSSSSQCSSARLMFFSSSSETDQYSTTTTTLNRKQTSKLKYQQKQQQNQKVRQPPIPISPGRMSRIATFLSSIFSSENVKKAKMCYVGAVQDVTFQSNSNSPPPCSTKKSCISKKIPSTSSSTRNVKRSVRFYPVSVILGEEEEDSNSIQQQRTVLPRNNSSIKELKNINNVRGIYDDDDDDDGLSYSSSDLFELDHLIGDERYQEELPVYETTSLETNKAIARNGLR